MVYNLRFFFPSKCSLFHNSNVFGSCIFHILYTGCAKIKKIIPAPKSLIWRHYTITVGPATTAPFVHSHCHVSHLPRCGNSALVQILAAGPFPTDCWSAWNKSKQLLSFRCQTTVFSTNVCQIHQSWERGFKTAQKINIHYIMRRDVRLTTASSVIKHAQPDDRRCLWNVGSLPNCTASRPITFRFTNSCFAQEKASLFCFTNAPEAACPVFSCHIWYTPNTPVCVCVCVYCQRRIFKHDVAKYELITSRNTSNYVSTRTPLSLLLRWPWRHPHN